MSNLKGSSMAASMAVKLMADQFVYPDEAVEPYPRLHERLVAQVLKHSGRLLQAVGRRMQPGRAQIIPGQFLPPPKIEQR